MLKSTFYAVAIPSPLYRTFYYLPPELSNDKQNIVVAGCRVWVPFGNRKLVGIVLESTDSVDFDIKKLKKITAIIDVEPILTEAVLRLVRWASKYYHHPIGDAFSAALPALLRQGNAIERLEETYWQIKAEGEKALAAEIKGAAKQKKLLHLLQEHAHGLSITQLNEQMPQWRDAMSRMEKKAWVESIQKQPTVDINSAPDKSTIRLNAQQIEAVQKVQQCEANGTFLLQGVTGSGKTEVYLSIIERIIAQNKQVMVLVPEIGLTPQLFRRFKSRLSAPIVMMHSALTDKERLAAWHHAQTGEAKIIIGTRSAIFMPLANPGLYIIDEEHDVSLKQQEGFRYNARDLAIIRAKWEAVPIILGSATPSLESLQNLQQNGYHHLVLSERAGKAKPPKLFLVNVKGKKLQAGMSFELMEAIHKRLENQQQVLLFINRRGYAPAQMCHQCGWLAECKRCDARMTYHQKSNQLICHHCGSQAYPTKQCPQCNSDEMVFMGAGTEQIENLLCAKFPGESIARIDRDTTRSKKQFAQLLDDARTAKAKILIGTQMLAKGHHFPNVTLVGILDIDQGLLGADFRASERMAQLITQVAGRAGRVEQEGEVFVQTHYPEHPILQGLLHKSYTGITPMLLQERQQTAFPPFSHLALIRAEAPSNSAPLDFLQNMASLAGQWSLGDVEVFPAMPAPMERRAGKYRAQLLLQSQHREALHRLLSQLVQYMDDDKAAKKVRWSIDVDPLEML